MKKKLTSILLVCLLLTAAAALTACGEKPEAAQAPAQPEQTAAAAEQAAPEEAPVQTQQAPAPTPEEAPPAQPETADAAEAPSALETALGFVDQDAGLLLDALGEPQERLYEASCSGPGDDGIWVYADVRVFTYRENGIETVIDAE